MPSWRPDVEGKADIVEEIVRIVGVDRVPLTPFDRGDAPRKPVLTPIQSRTRKAKRALAARGMVEAVTWSFIAKPQAELFGGGQTELALANPIAADLSDMRPSLIPGLVADRAEQCRPRLSRRRAVRGRADFQGRQAGGPVHRRRGVRRGMASAAGIGRHWSGTASRAMRFDVKADALAVLAAAGAPAQALQIVPAAGPAWLHPGRSGTIQIGPQNVLGYFGELHPRALEALEAEGPLVAFEVILERIPEAKAKPTRAKPVLELSPFQPVTRDFAFIVDRAVKAADIVRAAQNVDRKLIAGVTVFDVYEGKGIDAGKKSVAIAVTMQPREKTMTDEEIEAVAAKIVAEVAKRTGGSVARIAAIVRLIAQSRLSLVSRDLVRKPASTFRNDALRQARDRIGKSVALDNLAGVRPRSVARTSGRQTTKVWNSPFSPHGSIPAGRSVSSV